MIDALEAMRRTLRCFDKDLSFPRDGSLGFSHLRSMLERASDGEFSYGKLCRWLGWMQAATVAAGVATLEEMKAINRDCKLPIPSVSRDAPGTASEPTTSQRDEGLEIAAQWHELQSTMWDAAGEGKEAVLVSKWHDESAIAIRSFKSKPEPTEIRPPHSPADGSGAVEAPTVAAPYRERSWLANRLQWWRGHIANLMAGRTVGLPSATPDGHTLFNDLFEASRQLVAPSRSDLTPGERERVLLKLQAMKKYRPTFNLHSDLMADLDALIDTLTAKGKPEGGGQ